MPYLAHEPVSFRTGTTSYIYPDAILPNVAKLASRVDDIELLFFELNKREDLPSTSDLAELLSWRVKEEITYSVHTPLDLRLASDSETERKRSIEKAQSIVTTTLSLDPSAYVVHVEKDRLACSWQEKNPDAVELARWRRDAASSLEEIISSTGIESAVIAVECLDYDFEWIEPVIEDLGLSVALDVGHIERDGGNLRGIVERNLTRTRIIHWHGVDGTGRDHRSIAFYPRDRALWLLKILHEQYQGVLTLEVFSEEDFESSMECLRSLTREFDGVPA